MNPSRLLLPLLVGCADPADPALVLRQFAGASAEPVYDAIWESIEADGTDLRQLEDGDTLQGALDMGLPDAGSLRADWSLAFRADDPIEDQVFWDWSFTIEDIHLSLSEAVVDGTGEWIVAHSWYDLTIVHHTWEGTLSIDGEPALPASFEAVFSGNLHRVEGRLGETQVDWSNDDPDLP